MRKSTKAQQTYGVVAERPSSSDVKSTTYQLSLHKGVLECDERENIAYEESYQLILDDWTARARNSEVEVIRAPSGVWEAFIALCPNLSQFRNSDTFGTHAERAQKQFEMRTLLHHIISHLGDENVLDPQGRIIDIGYTFTDQDSSKLAMSCRSTKRKDLEIANEAVVLNCIYHQIRDNKGCYDPRLEDIVMRYDGLIDSDANDTGEIASHCHSIRATDIVRAMFPNISSTKNLPLPQLDARTFFDYDAARICLDWAEFYKARLRHAPSLIKKESTSLLWTRLIVGEQGLKDLMASLDIIVDGKWFDEQVGTGLRRLMKISGDQRDLKNILRIFGRLSNHFCQPGGYTTPISVIEQGVPCSAR